jgi:membrane protein YqaA with SNARE-associated domain
LPAPVFALVAVEGSILNPTLVAFFAALGATLGEVTGYLLGYSGQVLVDPNTRVESWVRDHGFITLLVLAAVPNPFFDLAGIVAGYSGFPFDQFLLATFLGKSAKFWVIAHLLKKNGQA